MLTRAARIALACLLFSLVAAGKLLHDAVLWLERFFPAPPAGP